MVFTVYTCMILAGVLTVWGNHRYKSRGANWGRVLSAVAGVITVVLALSAMYLNIWPPHKSYGDKEAKYQYVAHKFLGREIAKRHPNARILVIHEMPDPLDTHQVLEAKLRGLREGMGSNVIIVREIAMGSDMYAEMVEGPDGMPMGDPLNPMFSAKTLDEHIDDNPDCDIVLSLLGLPPDVQEMKYWRRVVDKEEVPRLALADSNVYQLRPAIKAGVISVVLVNDHRSYDYEAPFPKDEQRAFDERFLLLTNDRIEAVAKEYPDMFEKR